MNRRSILIAGDLLKRSIQVEKLMKTITWHLEGERRPGVAFVDFGLENDKLGAGIPYSVEQLKGEILRSCDIALNCAEKISGFLTVEKHHKLVDDGISVFGGTRTNIAFICETKANRLNTDKVAVNLASTKQQLSDMSYVFLQDTVHNALYSTECCVSESNNHRIIRFANIQNDLIDVAAVRLRNNAFSIGDRVAKALMKLGQVGEFGGYFNRLYPRVDLSAYNVDLNDLDSDSSNMNIVAANAISDLGEARSERDLINIADYLNTSVTPLVMVRRF